ncbi:MAG TPA: glycosyltransferase 87 family protein [Actinomycetota bacterium]|nr:glycosyltransferase 87 family protein [Actinomycetota bacterium]
MGITRSGSSADAGARARNGRLALWASAGSFALVALVAATPGSPFTPVLPSEPSGPLRWLAERVGLDQVHGNALAVVGVIAVSLAAAAFLLVLREAWRGSVRPGTVLALSVGYLALLLLLPLLFSRDVYSYASYGRIAARYGANPYVATPADYPADALAAFVGPKWVDTPAVYGPLWTHASSLVVRAVDDVGAVVAAFRVLAIAASLATLLVVSRLLRRVRPEREAFALALIGLNPVVVFQSVASGHNDVVVMLAVAAAIALMLAERERWATVALALGVLVKVTAAVPLLLLWIAVAARRPRGERLRSLAPHVAIAALLGLVAAAPFLNTSDPTLGMAELATHEGWLAPSRFFRRLFDAVSGDALGFVPRVVVPLLLVGALAAIARLVVRRAPAIGSALVGASWGWGLLALMLLGPVLLPWYVTWALPLAWLLPRVPRAVLVATGVALTLSQWTSEPASFARAYDANVLFGHYVITPVVIGLLGWLLVDLWRRTRADAPLEDEPDEVAAPAREG